MSQDDLIPFLQKNELFSSLKEGEISEILPFIKSHNFEEGSWIFQEGDEGHGLFIIKSGTAEIVKEEKDSGQYQTFGTLQAGDYFGEMAYLENEKRSASVRTLQQVEVLELDLDGLQKDEKHERVYSKMVVQIGRKVSQHLRKADDSIIESLKEKLKFMQAYTQISKTLVHMFILMAIWFNISKLIQLFPIHKAVLDTIFTTSLLLVFGLSSLYVIKSSDYPLSFYGLTFNKWFRYSVEGILYSLPFLIFLFFLKWVVINEVEMFKDVPLFSLSHIVDNYKSILLYGAIYALFVPVQELVARGFLQSCFRNFFQGPDRAFMAILTSNLLFQMLHTVKDFWLALVSFFFGIFWGILFEQQKSIIGVSVSHAFLGVMGFFVLDYQTLFIIAGSY